MVNLTKLGEFGLIARIKKLINPSTTLRIDGERSRTIKTDTSVIKGTGDDCAVIKFSKDKYMLFTCDMLVEGVDFTGKERPYLVGRKAIAVSVSDIAACAGLPRYCLVSLGVPKNSSVEFIDKLIQGMLSLTGKYGINIVGGDISRSRQLTIDVSMLGIVEKKNLILRSGAKIGDIIFVTGKLGGSILGKHLRFIPRLKEARFLVKNFRVNSMIDISDGLAQDLGHILEESSTGAMVYEALIPVSKPRTFGHIQKTKKMNLTKVRGKDACNLNDALYGGEDFELLFTMSPHEAKKLYRKKLTGFKPIGEIVHKKYGLRLTDKRGKEKLIKPKGFQHF